MSLSSAFVLSLARLRSFSCHVKKDSCSFHNQSFLVAIVHRIKKFIVKPLGLIIVVEEDAHPRMTRVRHKVVQHQAVALDASLLDLAVRDSSVSIPDKLVTQNDRIARAILVVVLRLIGVHSHLHILGCSSKFNFFTFLVSHLSETRKRGPYLSSLEVRRTW